MLQVLIDLGCDQYPFIGDDYRYCQQTFACTIAVLTEAILPAVAGLMDAALKAEVGLGVEGFDLGGERYAKVGAAIDVGEDLFAAA